MSSANPPNAPKTIRKLHKPPTVATLHTPHQRPRKRLQKRHTAPPTTLSQSQSKSQQLLHQTGKSDTLFLLEHSPHPPTSSKSEILGVYSSLDKVTAGAFKHGAYAFSKEGVVDGSEYLSANGRIKIRSCPLQRSGPSAAVPERTVLESGELVRLDIPHPSNLVPGLPGGVAVPAQKAEGGVEGKGREKGTVVFMALHETTESVFCIGVFTSKPLAWGACLKDKSWLAWSDELEDEQRGVREGNCPEVSVRVKGGARQKWFVRVVDVDTHFGRVEEAEQKQESGVQEVLRVLEGVPVDVARFEVVRKDVKPVVGRAVSDLPVGVRDV